MGTRQALANYDIVYSILEELAVPVDSWYRHDAVFKARLSAELQNDQADKFERRRTLAACARVCRAFYTPASSILWRDLDDVNPLVETSGRKPAGPPPSEREVSLGLLSLSHINPRRTNWVRRIRDGHPCSRMWVRAPDGADGLPIFPCLTHLRWNLDLEDSSEIHHFLSPSLRSLHIIFHRSSSSTNLDGRVNYQESVDALLQLVAEKAPLLSYLRLTRADGLPLTWSFSVSQFEHLKTLHVSDPIYGPSMTYMLLPNLDSAQNITTLNLRMPCALAHYLEDAVQIIQSLSTQHLRALYLEHDECPTATLPSALLSLATALHSRYAHSLRVLDLRISCVGLPRALERPLLEHLHPLLRIPGLIELRVSLAPASVTAVVRAADVAAMARAWPQLERLHLACALTKGKDAEEGGVPLPIAALVTAAQACPRLEDVVFPSIAGPTAAGVQDATLSELEPRRRSAALKMFEVSDGGWESEIPDPAGIAQYLHAFFTDLNLRSRPLASQKWTQTVLELDKIKRPVSQLT